MTTKDKPLNHVVIVGCGEIGRRVARNWKDRGKTVYALARSEDTLDLCRQQHLMTLEVDLDDAETLVNLPLNEALIYYFAPPPRYGKEDTRMENFLASIQDGNLPSRIVYISTSGVYGDQQGGLINEDTPANPQVDRAHRRYHAETQLNEWGKNNNITISILRVGGIYGPGRLPLKRIRDQVPMILEHLAPSTNRIHAEDLAQICVAAALNNSEIQLFNVSDGTDSNMTEYFNTIADHCGLPRPPLVDWEQAEKTISEGMLSYLRESRRMDNSRMLEVLEIELKYPTLEQGLESCSCN